VNIEVQRRRMMITMGLTTVALVVALAAIVALLVFHLDWAIWAFVGAILGGFASHAWLIMGVAREKPGS
jgi:uncharacterized membrane protein YdbT with pleckstrin-like domain